MEAGPLVEIPPEILPPSPEQQPNRKVIERILKKMFAGYWQVVVVERLSGGMSGSQIWVVRPIRQDETKERRTVVKIAPANLIRQEWDAYEKHIKNVVTNVARLQGFPVYLDTEDKAEEKIEWGGLHYDLVGGGTSQVKSLYAHCLAGGDIAHLLASQLFKSLESLWRNNSRDEVEVQLRAIYDSVLPVNLFIEYAMESSNASPIVLTPDTWSSLSLKRGEVVQLEGFCVDRVNELERSVTLNLPRCDLPSDSRASGMARVSFRVRLTSAPDLDDYKKGQAAPRTVGIITKTRADELEEQARKAIGTDIDLSQPQVGKLPNPLLRLPDLLTRRRDIKLGSIHGDLNLDNIVLEDWGDNLVMHLVDFADARWDYVLHDLLRLEADVITRLIPAVLPKQDQLSPKIIRDLLELLNRTVRSSDRSAAWRVWHKLAFVCSGLPPELERPFHVVLAIRRAARQYLFEPDDWTEYHEGLALHLIAALKLRRSDIDPRSPMPKQIAFWGAAAALDILERGGPVSASPVPQAPPKPVVPRASVTRWLMIGLIVGLILYFVVRCVIYPPNPPPPPSATSTQTAIGTVAPTGTSSQIAPIDKPAVTPAPFRYQGEAENPPAFTGGQMINRSNACGGMVHGQFGCASTEPWPARAGEIRYIIPYIPKLDHLYLTFRYSKNTPYAVPIYIHLDDEAAPREKFEPDDQTDWDRFTWSDRKHPIDLGAVSSGVHSIRLYTLGQPYGVVDLDRFILSDTPVQGPDTCP